jgi:hypothetical protein
LCASRPKSDDAGRYSVAVVAESLYEAAARAVRSFADAGCPPTQGTDLEIEVKGPAVTHTIKLNRVFGWVNGVAKSSKDKVLKERLKELRSALP